MTPPADAPLTLEARAMQVAADVIRRVDRLSDSHTFDFNQALPADVAVIILAALHATEQETWEAARQLVNAIQERCGNEMPPCTDETGKDCECDYHAGAFNGLNEVLRELRARATERGGMKCPQCGAAVSRQTTANGQLAQFIGVDGTTHVCAAERGGSEDRR